MLQFSMVQAILSRHVTISVLVSQLTLRNAQSEQEAFKLKHLSQCVVSD